MSAPQKTKLVISIKMDTFQRIKKSLPSAFGGADVFAKAHVQEWIGEYIDKMRGLSDCSEARREKERSDKWQSVEEIEEALDYDD